MRRKPNAPEVLKPNIVTRAYGNDHESDSTIVNQTSEARNLILELVSGGATKVAIAKATGVTDMTILSVSKGTTKTFRKLKQLQRVYDRWKAGTLDLSGKRGKKAVVALVAEETLAGKKDTGEKKASAGKKSSVKMPKVVTKPDVAVKTKRGGRALKKTVVDFQAGFQIPDVTEEMVAGVEEQIRRLQAEAKFMRDLIAIRKKYGQ